MEGLRWERTVLLSTPTMRTDFFRPMRRAVTDLSFARKRRNKGDTGLRSSRSNQVVPVVSVQYDVPKTPPSPMMYRYRRHHTPCATNSGPPQTQKNKTEEKQNIISHPIEFPLKLSARLEFEIKEERRLRQELKKQDHLANIDNHRIKGLGVGKLYSEYQPLPTSQGQELVPPATAPAQVPVLEQMNNLSFSSPVSCYYGFQHASQGQGPGHGSIASIEPPSSTRAQKGSIHSPCHTSLSQYQQLSGSQAPTPDGFGFNNSSSTPTVPYSTADILYGSEVNSRPPAEELRQNSLDLEKSKELSRLKAKDLEQHPNNRRPNSKSASRKSLSVEAATIDREESLKSLSNTLPPTKPSNHFRPNGIRSNILKGEQMFSSTRSNGAASDGKHVNSSKKSSQLLHSGRDPDDLVAMGTLWSPNNPNSSQGQPQQQPMSRSSIPNNISSNAFPTKSNPSSSSVNPSMSASTTMTPQRKYTSNNVRPIVVQNNTISGIRNNLKEKDKEKDVEPKYTDPLIGAPASYQQRLIELGALEGDTVRWERTKRLKKKKQDRDS